MQLNLDEIRAIAKMVKEKGLDEVVVESTDVDAPACRLQLRKNQPSVMITDSPEAPPHSAEVPPEPDAHLLVVTSPTVGIFHFAGEPLTKGQRVEEMQIIGSVESLKVPTEVRLSNSGVVESVLVEKGQGVEFGQPLLELQIDA